MQLHHCLLVLVTAYVISFVTSQPTPSEDFAHHVILDRNEYVRLHWKIEDVYIIFEMHGRTTGWVGIGFSPNGGMIGADIFVGWVKDGVSSVSDRHGLSSNTFPPLDDQQDVTLLGGEERDGWTRIKFRRQIAGCEENADITLTTSTVRIIWALGLSDPQGDDITPTDYHGYGIENRGQRSVLVLEAGGEASAIAEEDTDDFSFLNDHIHVPAKTTYYNCKLFKFPRLPSKRHVIKIEPVIDPENEIYVHHILLYQCARDPLDTSNINRSHECYVRNMPGDFVACSLLIHAWGIGSQALIYPDHVGFPISTDDAPRYALMEVHYDNPKSVPGIVDNSGLRFIFTSNLRQYDSGMLETGRAVFPYTHLIPPNAESFITYGECPSDCIGHGMRHINRSDIRIFGAFLHSHLLGRAITLRHIAENGTTELPIIAQDNSYDFNYQEVKIFPQEVTFRLGDSLQTTCNYNSTGRKNFTTGGLEATDEMCLVYVFYYPKVPLTSCTTSPIPNLQLLYFGIFKTTYLLPLSLNRTLDDVAIWEPENLVNRSLGDVLNAMEWNQSLAKSFSNYDKHVYRFHRCMTLVDLNISTHGSPPNIIQPYQAPVPKCIQPLTSAPTQQLSTTSSAHLLRVSLSLVITSCMGLVTML